MDKSNTFFRQPIFCQLINLLDKNKIDGLAKESGTDHYCEEINTFSGSHHHDLRGHFRLQFIA